MKQTKRQYNVVPTNNAVWRTTTTTTTASHFNDMINVHAPFLKAGMVTLFPLLRHIITTTIIRMQYFTKALAPLVT
jgi:hypothetical protein